MPAPVSSPEITAVSRICSAAASGQPIHNVVCAESSSHEPRRILAPPAKQTCLHELLPCKLQVRASWRQKNRDGQVGSPGP
jgi:hypothetical protein